MRFLQTSDWHLGKTFHERTLNDDQEIFLNQIIFEIEKESKSKNPYSALLIPGDIYDKSIPSQDSITLFDNFLTQIKDKFPSLYIIIISGNHDSPKRLNFAQSFFRKNKIFITTTTASYTTPIELESNKEKAYIYTLPFLYPNDIQNSNNELFTSTLSQQEMYDYATKSILQEHSQKHSDGLSILCAHLFANKALVEQSERRNIGTAEQVSANLFEQFDYTAVGHIHSFQPCGSKKNMYYSGSPLQYDFGDSPEKCMISVEVKKNKSPIISKILFKPLHKVTRLEGSFSDFIGSNAKKELIEEHKNDFIEIICTDNVIPSSPRDHLISIFPNFLSFKMKETIETEMNMQIQQRRKAIAHSNGNLSEDIFQVFLDEINSNSDQNKDLIEKEKKLFGLLINQKQNNNYETT
jgi:DNA repair protein SbcD/Mre11